MAREEQDVEEEMALVAPMRPPPTNDSLLSMDSLTELLQAPTDLVKTSEDPGHIQQSNQVPSGGYTADGVFDHVDFLGTSESVKALFRLPYSREGVSLALHKVDRMLVVDGSLHELFPQQHQQHRYEAAEDQQPQEQQPSRQGEEKGGPNHLSLSPMKSTSPSPPSPASKVAVTPAFRVPPPPFQLPPAPEPLPQVLNWRFHELRLVMGSNIRVYGDGKDHPRVAAMFHDVEKELELVTCIDAYLENVFASIPELAVCMRAKGFLDRDNCHLVRTEEIPFLTLQGRNKGQPSSPSSSSPSSPTSSSSQQDQDQQPLFDPRMLDLNATTLLRFLKENCVAEGSTYLLYRDEGGTTVQLYDVTAISATRQKRWKWLLAMLSYRFACRIFQQAHYFTKARRAQLQQRQRRLLQTCLDLIKELMAMAGEGGGGGQHESLCAAVEEQMAETYMRAARDTSTTEISRDDSSEDDLCKARQHLQRGISIFDTLCRGGDSDEEEEEEEEEGEEGRGGTGGGGAGQDEDVAISFGSFTSASHKPITGGTLTKRGRGVQGGGDDDDDGGAVQGRSGDDRRGGRRRKRPPHNKAGLMVLEQLLGLRRKMVEASVQLAKIYIERKDMRQALGALRDAAAQVSDAAWGSRVADPQPWDDGTGLKDRVRGWVMEASGRVWGAVGDLAHAVSSHPEEWSHQGRSDAPHEEDSGDDGDGEEEDVEDVRARRTRRVVEMVLKAIINLEEEAALGTQDLQSAPSELLPVLLPVQSPSSSFSLSTMTLLYLHPHTSSTILLHHGSPKRHSLESSVLDAAGPRSFKLLRVASAMAYSRAAALLLSRCRPSPPSPSFASAPVEDMVVVSRFGDACNEVGKSLREVLVELGGSGTKGATTSSSPSESPQALELCCESAQWWLRRAETVFKMVADRKNVAVAALNLAGLFKAKARFNIPPPGTTAQDREQDGVKSQEEEGGGGQEALYEAAIGECCAAHEALGDREEEPRLWDGISEEMAMVNLMRGVARRQAVLGGQRGNSNRAQVEGEKEDGTLGGSFLSAKEVSLAEERRVLDPLERALDIYKRLGNLSQKAAVHFQMGSFFSKIWMGQADKKRARVRLAEAMTHYNASFEHYYRRQPRDPTLLRIITDLADLYLAVDTATKLQGGNPLCLKQALECLLKSRHSFTVRLDDDSRCPAADPEPTRARLTRTLQALVRASAQQPAMHAKYKDMYRVLIKGGLEQRPFTALLSELHEMNATSSAPQTTR